MVYLEVSLTIGETLQIGGQTITVIDIEDGELVLRIDDDSGFFVHGEQPERCLVTRLPR